jgi:hypothetical protein
MFTMEDAVPRDLKRLGWIRFSFSGVWVSPTGARYHDFESAVRAALQEPVEESDKGKIGEQS